MSAQQGKDEGDSDSHSEGGGLIRTPKQLIAVVLLSFIVPVAIIVMLAKLVTGEKNVEPAGSSAKAAEIIAERLRPVGQLWLAGEPAPAGAMTVAVVAAVKVEKTGEAVYTQVCAACHTSGALNAPKLGDKAAWAKLIPEGADMLTKQSIAGIRQMPARGGNPALTDLEMKRAVVYLANGSGAKFKEPPAPAAPAAPVVTAAVATGAAATGAVVTGATVTTVAAAASPGAAKSTAGDTAVDGEAIYKKSCAACHMTGAAGAPRSGDKTAWAPRIKKGEDALVASALKGIGVMPPRGGNPALTDAQIRAAVQYQIKTNR